MFNLLKKIFQPKPKIEVGQKIRVISWPRPNDGADAYANSVGTVVDIDYNEITYTNTSQGKYKLKGWISIRLESGAYLTGMGLQNLKYEICG